MQQKVQIRTLEEEIQRLRDMNANGDQATEELRRMLSETEEKLREALSKISDLEGVLRDTDAKNEQE
jgi:ABC-type transporter Mla subunit MlaD